MKYLTMSQNFYKSKLSLFHIFVDRISSVFYYVGKAMLLIFDTFNQRIKCQCYLHIETSQLICIANQLTRVYMWATLALNGLCLIF